MELNLPASALAAGNTGIPTLVFTPEKIVGAILIDKSKVIAAADIATLITELQTLVIGAGKDRVFPIFRFEEITDNSEDTTITTLGYGNKVVTREGKYDWTFRLTKGGYDLQKRLRTFNLKDYKVLFVDSNNTVIGTLTADGDLAGFTMDFFHAKAVKIADGSNKSIYHVRFALSKPEELNDNIAYVVTGVDVEEEVKGIIDLELVQAAVASGKATVKVRTAVDHVDMYDDYADALAAGGNWSVKKAGVVVTISGVVKNATLKAWEVSFTGTGVHNITLAAPSVLAAASIGGAPDNGYEADTLSVTMP